MRAEPDSGADAAPVILAMSCCTSASCAGVNSAPEAEVAAGALLDGEGVERHSLCNVSVPLTMSLRCWKSLRGGLRLSWKSPMLMSTLDLAIVR